MNKITKIAIVDSHAFFRSGLSFAIKRIGFTKLVFASANGSDFLEKQALNPVDLVIMDINMPGIDGYNLVMQMKSLYPYLKIVILTESEKDETIQKFLNADINGYLLKNIDQKGLAFALKVIIEGQNYYSPELLSYFTRQLKSSQGGSENKVKLSKRELEILQMIFDGYSNQEIARKLFISVRTVTNHKFNIKSKTSAKNTAGLISFGLNNNLLKR